jgi:hypothetical protein
VASENNHPKSVPEIESGNLKRKPAGMPMQFLLFFHELAELLGGRPEKRVKEGVSDKTLGRRFEKLDALVETGMHSSVEVFALMSSR